MRNQRGAAALFLVLVLSVLSVFVALGIDYCGRGLLAKTQGIVYTEALGLSGNYEYYPPDYTDLGTDTPDWEQLVRYAETRQYVQLAAANWSLPFGDRLAPYYREQKISRDSTDMVAHLEIEGSEGNYFLPIPEDDDIRFLPDEPELPAKLRVQAIRDANNPIHFTFARGLFTTNRNKGITLEIWNTSGLLPARGMTSGSVRDKISGSVIRFGFMPMVILWDPATPHPMIETIDQSNLNYALNIKCALSASETDFDSFFISNLTVGPQALIAFLAEGLDLPASSGPSLSVGDICNPVPESQNKNLLTYMNQHMLRQTWIVPVALRSNHEVLGFVRIFARTIDPSSGVISFALAPTAATPGASFLAVQNNPVHADTFFWQLNSDNAPLSAKSVGIAAFPATLDYE